MLEYLHMSTKVIVLVVVFLIFLVGGMVTYAILLDV